MARSFNLNNENSCSQKLVVTGPIAKGTRGRRLIRDLVFQNAGFLTRRCTVYSNRCIIMHFQRKELYPTQRAKEIDPKQY